MILILLINDDLDGFFHQHIDAMIEQDTFLITSGIGKDLNLAQQIILDII